MVRQGAYFFEAFLLAMIILYSAWTLGSKINHLNSLRRALFQGEVDPNLLDERVSYECFPVPRYSVGTRS